MGDTIAAIATPPGLGGIAVIRVSGPEAETIAGRIFRPKGAISRLRSHTLHAGTIVSPSTGEIVDEVLAVIMRKPRSYTGEDVLEIHCHGGYVVPRAVLEAVLQAGARPAEAGEFTRRAFLNDRMDLSQAEAVGELITAATSEGARLALSHLGGAVGARIAAAEERLMDLLARLEASLDFGEDEGIPAREGIADRIQEEVRLLNDLADTYRTGRLYRQGAGVVIMGRTNVGKSSLLNRLLGETRAIVTPLPGTTRDFIEEAVDVVGLPVRLTDTAGIRPTDDMIEQAGIDLVWERVGKADAVILLFDGSEPITAEDRDIAERLAGKKVLYVINKSDLAPAFAEKDLPLAHADATPLRVSAKTGEGMETLKEALYRLLTASEKGEGEHDGCVLTVLRHRLAVEKAVFHLCQASGAAVAGAYPELIAEDLRDALDALGEISGRTVNDAVLDRIFAHFCIGK
ncbi:MAG TPA: tRNA uridine-5-carboxymethylaminomethyl(34) synthesis GTPase MnmE [Syntrophales bacterium]|nr:tRNA uridine-5-carboxymethylaminomethyl(34) synthesis GTPase MnmE [Syntrophales bacterium]HOM07502.1 tRNA uridine-5-carboxymethylaminomethyl(34) synthesis GTPase MnmE [Syntrophales bacterium]HON99829.1 tRNA uridine-5-carboxymethylaminomethyl(34) synthesis GTPase MnmE [Syntrophales bacterium]HPC01454.1 tRNA uridine-5-carboxymethylaminomethyl(34) synthesis GTPase MnmE [Syntrophales bacterium]HPQ07153.1 tRNA uridine-5-carboxymethylaminomethyl(34) synthesis GTPase MnmE [Syntrophales bacterium]